ncbi:hypothetical protein AQUCO_00100861v1 [Aquilegia coerulea]|uniref:Uncharacterized protein n=1 Tax=Aquilegia coerulea TaxID=218851 RepID=A0A2G5FCE8_AQUCA|nr:hypothetical protein AQUCO_00100861v1 [Aquilegia coerulea]
MNRVKERNRTRFKNKKLPWKIAINSILRIESAPWSCTEMVAGIHSSMMQFEECEGSLIPLNPGTAVRGNVLVIFLKEVRVADAFREVNRAGYLTTIAA